jgi:hypothetical protein
MELNRSENPVHEADSPDPRVDIEGGTPTKDDELVRLIDARLNEKLGQLRDAGSHLVN